jgi:hypothetical protein
MFLIFLNPASRNAISIFRELCTATGTLLEKVTVPQLIMILLPAPVESELASLWEFASLSGLKYNQFRSPYPTQSRLKAPSKIWS